MRFTPNPRDRTHESFVKNKPMKPLKDCWFSTSASSSPDRAAAMRLADLGARVIKIERPGGGDIGRQLYISNSKLDGDSTLFHSINRNKQSFAADLKNPADLAPRQKIGRTGGCADPKLSPGRDGSHRPGLRTSRATKSKTGLRHCHRLRHNRSVGGFAGSRFAGAKPQRSCVVERRCGSSAHADGTCRLRSRREPRISCKESWPVWFVVESPDWAARLSQPARIHFGFAI